MKTISEMQQQIKEMSGTLDELARDLIEYGHSDKVEQNIDFKQIKAIGRRNPLVGHPLEDVESDAKKKYIILLVAAICTASGNPDDAWLLVQRIASGAGCDEELADIHVDALSITEEQIEEYTYEIHSLGLSQSFALDAMLIYLSYGKQDEAMLAFMAALFELVKCDKKEIEGITSLAIGIATQDESQIEKGFLNTIDFSSFENIKLTGKPYFKNGIICNTEKCLAVFGELNQEEKDVLSKTISAKHVIFCKVKFENITLEIKDSDHVIIQECSLENIWIHSTAGETQRTVLIDHCLFGSGKKCKDTAVALFQNNLMISNSQFHDISSCETVLHAYSNDTTFIDNCKFSNLSTSTSCIEISGTTLIANNCVLENVSTRSIYKAFYNLCKKYTIKNCTAKNCSEIYGDTGFKYL